MEKYQIATAPANNNSHKKEGLIVHRKITIYSITLSSCKHHPM